MILKEFSYLASKEKEYRLKVDEMPFNHVNLVVGRNSVGKSTITHLISNIARMISQQNSSMFGGYYSLIFLTNENKEIRYEYSVKPHEYKIEEELYFDNEKILNRKGDDVWIYSFKEKKKINITPPEEKSILHVRRDKIDYPIIEKLIYWAESTYLFKFGMLSPEDVEFHDIKENYMSNFLDIIPHDIYKMDSADKNTLFEEMAIFGYNINNINVTSLDRPKSILINIYLEEYAKPIIHRELSQGFLRTLFLLIFINSRIKEQKTSTLLIDDLCEGLDYDRATKLGKLIIEKFKENNIQLIATSNDSFLMDVFPIKYWNVLTRDGNVINTINYQNNTELFEKFKYTGLSNFDFFSSDYIIKGK